MDVAGAIIVSEGGVSFGENELHVNSKNANAMVMENVKARCKL
jgi:hypothetical protein